MNNGRKASIFGTAAVGPGIGTAILAKAACPFCYPAIASLLTSLGLGFLFESKYMIFLTLIFLGIVLFGLAFKASSRRGYFPLLLGIISSVTILIGKFIYDTDYIFYLGIGGLLTSSIWNLIPKTNLKKSSCPSCATAGVSENPDANGE